MLEATKYIIGGKCVTDKDWNSTCTKDGRTLSQVVDDVAENSTMVRIY